MDAGLCWAGSIAIRLHGLCASCQYHELCVSAFCTAAGETCCDLQTDAVLKGVHGMLPRKYVGQCSRAFAVAIAAAIAAGGAWCRARGEEEEHHGMCSGALPAHLAHIFYISLTEEMG